MRGDPMVAFGTCRSEGPTRTRIRATMDVALPIVSFLVGTVGVVLGARLTRQNEKVATSERLLLEAINDALSAIAKTANSKGKDTGAKADYASAMSRIGFHASPPVIAAFRRFQDDATTVTLDGQARLLTALNLARKALGQDEVSESDLAVLLFGPGGPVRTQIPTQEALTP